MAYRFGVLTMADVEDYTLVNNVGQGIVYQDLALYLMQREADLQAALAVFMSGMTEDHTVKYKLPGGGRLQRRGGQAQSAAAKRGGSWDVAFPLEDFGEQLAWTDRVLGYMSVREFNAHINNIEEADRNTVRFEMLKALFNNGSGSPRVFADELWGNLNVQPLANGDSVVYPPVLGSETEATANQYLGSNYLASAISDTNNPIATMVEALATHFGESTGGNEIVVFINQAQAAKVRALTDFYPVNDRDIRTGVNTDVPVNLPNVPGVILGRCSGAWIVQWRWIPANYMLGLHLEAEAPLMMRVDPASTNLVRGLHLAAQDEIYPFNMAHWSHAFGFGVGNRLNGVVMYLNASTSYTIPTDFA